MSTELEADEFVLSTCTAGWGWRDVRPSPNAHGESLISFDMSSNGI
ncbi:MAG: hypothetical protein V2B19_03135 [Pseudomonadota bacterium]